MKTLKNYYPKCKNNLSNCEEDNPYFNKDYFAYVVVKSINDRDNIPCKLRQRGMSAIVVDENFSEFQMQSEDYCNNNGWVQIGTGSPIKDEGNLFIFDGLNDATTFLETAQAKDGQIIYVSEQDIYYTIKNKKLEILSFSNVTKEFRVTAPAGSFSYGEIFPEGLNIAEAFEKLLTTIERAVVTNTGGASFNNQSDSYTHEVGTWVIITLNLILNRGIVTGTYVNDVWNKNSIIPYLGTATNYSFNVFGEIINNGADPIITTPKFFVKEGSQQIVGTITYGSNTYYKDSSSRDTIAVNTGTVSKLLTFIGAYRTFLGSVDSLTTGVELRNDLLDNSILNAGNNLSFTTGTTNKIFIIAIPVSKELVSVKNTGTNEDLVFELSTDIVNIPVANDDLVDYKVYVLNTSVPFSQNYMLQVTLN